MKKTIMFSILGILLFSLASCASFEYLERDRQDRGEKCRNGDAGNWRYCDYINNAAKK